ncbi:disabled homolog 1-like isoform X2 [Platichthys flesus]|uniref:disabled homolog 1-like isoform X2 n=1 Tax=Platichthys flesus TaxID=8260 RepID=UPI002DBA5655|nr:disabled homolog 1-like isoform X2 [Platichthys flesus]
MMETEQTAGSCPAPGQTSVRTWLSSSSRAAARSPADSASRFHGDGVRYKAKVIGVDPVPNSRGEKMCWDSMMKLKGFDAAARRQGKHKQRVWLKVFSSGLKILDERSGAVLHDHERSRISSLTEDESDPRALAYVYQHQDTYSLFYIKMANLAGPVLADIKEVCQCEDQETPQEPAETQTQVQGSLLVLNDSSSSPDEAPAFEGVFSPRPESSLGRSQQVSPRNALMEVFSIQMDEPISPTDTSCTSQPDSPQPTLSTSQILSMFPTQPPGGSPYSSPPYSPTPVPWGQNVLPGNQWAGPAMAPWPTTPGNIAAWPPAAITAPPAGSPHGMLTSPPGVMWGGSTPSSPTTANGYASPVNSINVPSGATGSMQSVPTSLDQNLLL